MEGEESEGRGEKVERKKGEGDHYILKFHFNNIGIKYTLRFRGKCSCRKKACVIWAYYSYLNSS